MPLVKSGGQERPPHMLAVFPAAVYRPVYTLGVGLLVVRPSPSKGRDGALVYFVSASAFP
jgi:hypothetical protein